MLEFMNKPSVEDLYEFFYVWQMYEDFGIRSEEAVAECAKSAKKQAVKEIMTGMQKEMRNGASTADAMRKFPELFPAYVVEMVQIGERSGSMHEILSNLVFSLEHEMEMEKDIRSAMWMPKIFVGLLSICFSILVFYVIPRMGDVLGEMDMRLPLITSLVLNFGHFMVSYWFVVLLVLVLLYFAWNRLMVLRPDIRDTVRFRFPALGPIRLAQLHFRLTSILGMCLEANVPIRTAVCFAADSSDSYYMRGTLMAALRRMEASGSSFLDALQQTNMYEIIPENFFILLRVGSKGNLGQIMLKLADRKQKEILRLSKQVGDKLAFSVIMPAALVLVFLVLSIELPIWDIMNNDNLANMGGGGGM